MWTSLSRRFSPGNVLQGERSLQLPLKQDALREAVVETVAADRQCGWVTLAQIDGHPRVTQDSLSAPAQQPVGRSQGEPEP